MVSLRKIPPLPDDHSGCWRNRKCASCKCLLETEGHYEIWFTIQGFDEYVCEACVKKMYKDMTKLLKKRKRK